jgi:1-acyl-sn-glycerol-3-phosphate acyltransferase
VTAQPNADLSKIKPQQDAEARPASFFDSYHAYARSHEPGAFYGFIRVISTLYVKLCYRVKYVGLENVPADGRVILAPSHYSFGDHFFVAWGLGRPVRFMAKSQMFVHVMKYIAKYAGAFPVRRGLVDTEAMDTAGQILKSEQVLVMYPNGSRIRTDSDRRSVKPGIGILSLLHDTPIVPVGISSSGVRDWRRLRFPPVIVKYGKAQRYGNLDRPGRKEGLEVAEHVVGRIHALEAEIRLSR